jgi:multidrug resistance efflux pump
MPERHAAIVPEVGGRVEKVLAREGSKVTKGQPIAQLDTKRLDIELETARQEFIRANAEADRLRGLGDEGQAKVAALQAVISEKNAARLQADIAAATLRSPIDGVVLTKDLELHAGEFIQAGSPFAEVASMDSWQLQVEVNERKVGRLEKQLAKGEPLPVNFILYSHSAHKLSTVLDRPDRISAMAYPRENQNVFYITLPNIQAPAEVREDFRPGLTGRAKINLHREPLFVWILTGIADWTRLKMLH